LSIAQLLYVGIERRDISEAYARVRGLDICRYRNILADVARSSTTADVFNAVAERSRRDILDVLIGGEKAVGTIVNDLALTQPQVSKHLRVLSEVGLVTYRADGRRRVYRLEPGKLQPLLEWLSHYEEMVNARLDRMDDYIKDLQRQGEAP
jgi:DNA-binding transcriptional ArsR family regulator